LNPARPVTADFAIWKFQCIESNHIVDKNGHKFSDKILEKVHEYYLKHQGFFNYTDSKHCTLLL
jgi:hypothetical protein